jgi:hypothetical protein
MGAWAENGSMYPPNHTSWRFAPSGAYELAFCAHARMRGFFDRLKAAGTERRRGSQHEHLFCR